MSGTSIKHNHRAHSYLGASSASRWFECPGSVALHKKHGDLQGTSKYAQEGTAAHELAETCLFENKVARDYIGDEMNGHVVTEEMAEAVQVYVDHINELCNTHEGELLLEERFTLDWIDNELFGTNDACLIVHFDHAFIVDYKHGQGVAVNPEENKQLMYYALGACKYADVDQVTMTIVQPRREHPDGPVRSWTVPWSRIEQFEKELIDAVKRTEKRDATLVSGNHCRFCPVSPICPALRNKSLEVAQQSFDIIEDVKPIELPKPDQLSDEQLKQVLEASEMIKHWAGDVAAYVKHRLEQGHSIDGYKLVRKRTNRKWANEGETIRALEEFYGDEIFNKKLKTPAQMEKIASKKDVADLTTRPQGDIVLAPITDKREAVVPAIQQFEEI